MIKKYEIEEIIQNGLYELDGIVSDKPNENGNYDLYSVDIYKQHNDLICKVTTDNKDYSCVDEYRIKIEYNEPCDYCVYAERDKSKLGYNMKDANYCPMCGRKLGD